MQDDLKVAVRKSKTTAIIDMKGNVTSFADNQINSFVKTSVEEGCQHILFNFTDVSYINSSGIAILIGLVTSPANNEVTFKVYGLTPHFKRIFRMIGLTQYIEVLNLESEEEAVASFDA
ncbi:anti-sigma factor antagonist [candidate division KSB3 bacterium]|uniref:Anti-sigma factor antagonist n=1 Tax=candidate division KSB3 bacterium TaxID=2044937 RepID=A0A9D5K0C0_9BACT|nr:anti-sigma factor antagonist [candidate division KSB3 bacterium]MBD3327037.1 anti-sigma factor antagonist [candidate division KSB3 bacterium]